MQLEFLGWPAEDSRWAALEHYMERVRDAGLSLVSQADRERILERHLLPSLEALDLIPETGQLMDIGSGGGFPGLPLGLCRPGLQVTLVESNARKSAFLRRVSRETNAARSIAARSRAATNINEEPADNITVICSRAEELGPGHEGQFDLITARAVADLPELIEWTQRFLAPDGRWLFWKGRAWRKEGDPADYGLELIQERKLSDGGRLLVLRKRMRDEG